MYSFEVNYVDVAQKLREGWGAYFEKYAFPVFILITHEDKKSKSFSAFINLGKQKRPSGMPPGLFCFPTGMQKCPRAV